MTWVFRRLFLTGRNGEKHQEATAKVQVKDTDPWLHPREVGMSGWDYLDSG